MFFTNATDKMSIATKIDNIASYKTCCVYTLERPWQGISYEYPQHKISMMNLQNLPL